MTTPTTDTPAPDTSAPAPATPLALDAEQTRRLLDLLGLPADTTDPEVILATVADVVTQAADATDPQPSAVAAAAARVGLDVVDADTLAALRRDAAEGRQIRAAAERQAVEDAVDRAIAAGKITPGRRQHWVSLISADPGMADVLASVPDETAAPITEKGHGVDSEDRQNQPPDQWFY